MKDALESESDQWIPWEISYSLKETKRADRTSHMNALLGIALPDASGSYSYMITENKCCSSGCTSYNLNDIGFVLGLAQYETGCCTDDKL